MILEVTLAAVVSSPLMAGTANAEPEQDSQWSKEIRSQDGAADIIDIGGDEACGFSDALMHD